MEVIVTRRRRRTDVPGTAPGTRIPPTARPTGPPGNASCPRGRMSLHPVTV